MRKTLMGRRLARSSAGGRWLTSIVFAAAMMAGQAHGEATDDTSVFSPKSFSQVTTVGDWADVINNLPSGFTPLITARPYIVMEQDRDTVAFSAAFFPDATYRASYYVMVRSARAGTDTAGAGLIRTTDGAAITAVLPNVPFSLPATPALSTLTTLGDVTEASKTGATAESSLVPNSLFAVPEPHTMDLMGTGLLVLAGAVRRRNSK